MALWTTDDLLSAVRARGGIPTTNQLLTPAETLQLATEEQDTTVAEVLRAAGGTYGVNAASDASIVSGTALYELPSRAVGAGLLGVWYVEGTTVLDLKEIPPEESWRYRTEGDAVWQAPYGYCYEGNAIRLLPTPSTSAGAIRFVYFRRPGRLVETSRCGAVLAPATTTTLTLDVTQAPGSLVTTAAARIDIVRGDPPFDGLYDDRVVASFATPTLTLDAGTPISTSVVPTRVANDNRPRAYVCPANESCIPQIPVEAHALLVAATVRSVMEAMKDSVGLKNAYATVERETKALRTLLEPRTRGSSSAIVNMNSPYRGGGRR